VELINWIWFAGAIASAAMLGIADAIEALWLALLWVTETLLAAMQFGRNWQILLQKSAIAMTRRQPAFWESLIILLLLGAGHSGMSLTGWTGDMHWARKTCIDHRWRSGDQLYEPAKILGDRCQHELKLRTARPA